MSARTTMLDLPNGPSITRRCLCCRRTFQSWDRRKNRMCRDCTTFSPSPYAPDVTPEVDNVTSNGFHVAGFGA